MTQAHKPHYDSLKAWLAQATDDEIIDAILATFSEEEVEEFVETFDELLRANPEQ